MCDEQIKVIQFVIVLHGCYHCHSDSEGRIANIFKKTCSIKIKSLTLHKTNRKRRFKMARPIKETPILTGADAERFLIGYGETIELL